MAESACLLRSFSHPSDSSREAREGEHIRALTESVSFGRFMSESLAWEKWSAFSHNRYLEEVERFAKPGSVAQKKAFFEAHYRRKAAVKEEALHIEESNSGEDVENSVSVTELREQEDAIECDEQQEVGFSDTSMGNSVASISSSEDVENPNAEMESMEIENNIKCDERQEDVLLDIPMDVSIVPKDVLLEERESENMETTCSASLGQDPATEDPAQNEKSTQMRDSDESIDIETAQHDMKQEAPDPRTSTSSGIQKRVVSSSKPLNQSKASKLPLPHAKGIMPREQRTRKNFAPRRDKLLVEKKKPPSKSLHMSINFASSSSSTSKTLSSLLQPIRTLGDITASVRLKQDSSISRNLPHKAAARVGMKVSSTTQKSEERRTRTLLNKSVAGRLMPDKTSSSLSKESSKHSFSNGRKEQTPIVCTPFRFRSEERAAKRKERQEEKVKATEAEKLRPPERFLLPIARPQSLTLGKKAMQGIRPEKKPRPPRQTSARVETADHLKGKSNPRIRGSVPSLLSRYNLRENSSPNIPQ